MVNSEEAYLQLVKQLDDNGVEYKLFSHKAALTYEDLLEVQKETGFEGSEGKCMILKVDEKFIVYVTLPCTTYKNSTSKGSGFEKSI